MCPGWHDGWLGTEVVLCCGSRRNVFFGGSGRNMKGSICFILYLRPRPGRSKDVAGQLRTSVRPFTLGQITRYCGTYKSPGDATAGLGPLLPLCGGISV